MVAALGLAVDDLRGGGDFCHRVLEAQVLQQSERQARMYSCEYVGGGDFGWWVQFVVIDERSVKATFCI